MSVRYSSNYGNNFSDGYKSPRSTDPDFEETWFYLVPGGLPKAEEIATVLLHLSNLPALFQKWAGQNGVPFKVDGHIFKRAHNQAGVSQ
jgi:hypothetical protein